MPSTMQTIVHSTAWLALFKLFKFCFRSFLGYHHELYRFCSVYGIRSFPTYSLLGRSFQQCLIAFHIDSLLFTKPIVTSLDPVGDADVEQQIITEAVKVPFKTVYRIDRSILYSTRLVVPRRQLEARDTLDIYPIFATISETKQFPVEDVTSLAVLYKTLIMIYTVSQFTHSVNLKSSTKYDSTVRSHEKKLYEMYHGLMGKMPTTRISKEWQTVGFQGVDPATDFRGMGLLALDHLLYYSKQGGFTSKKAPNSPKGSRYALECSWIEDTWYGWALVGINLTAYLVQLLRSRRLQMLLFEILQNYNHRFDHQYWDVYTCHVSSNKNNVPHIELNSPANMAVQAHLTEYYNELFCWMFNSFNEFWMAVSTRRVEESVKVGAKYYPIMHFNSIFEEFKLQVEKKLLSKELNFGLIFESKRSFEK